LVTIFDIQKYLKLTIKITMEFGKNVIASIERRKQELANQPEVKSDPSKYFKVLPKRVKQKTWEDYVLDLSEKRKEGLVMQKDIAEHTGYSKSFLSNFFARKSPPTLKTYVTILNAIEQLSRD